MAETAIALALDRPERFNHLGRACPRCYRDDALIIRAGLYECADGCGARFRFLPETGDRPATLERVRVDSPWNAGARIADDACCQSCGARGYPIECPSCSTQRGCEAGR